MKKVWFIRLALALALMLAATAALAEDGLLGEIVDGGYVIRIPDESGDLGWLADEGDGAAVLADASHADGAFVVRYNAAADGEATVAVRHYIGIACDRVFTWDLVAKDGAIVECTGGSYTESPDPEVIDDGFIGEWQTLDGMGVMNIEKNPGGRAWDVEIVMAEAQGASVFKTTVYYDCDKNGFVYDKGKFWDTPITDSDEAPELGEAKIAGSVGMFTFVGDDTDLCLGWEDDSRAEEIVFRKVDVPLTVDYGASALYSKQDMDEAAKLVRAEFEGWQEIEMLNLRYAGDDCNTDENIVWLSDLDDKSYDQCLEFLSDLHTTPDAQGTMEPDTDYPDYQWWLAREAGGDWALVSWGY